MEFWSDLSKLDSVQFAQWLTKYKLKIIIFNGDIAIAEDDSPIVSLNAEPGVGDYWKGNANPQEFGIYSRHHVIVEDYDGNFYMHPRKRPALFDDLMGQLSDNTTCLKTSEEYDDDDGLCEIRRVYYDSALNLLTEVNHCLMYLVDFDPEAEDDFIQNIPADKIYFWQRSVSTVLLPDSHKVVADEK